MTLPTPDLARMALFLDFDGTLAPIVSHPADAGVTPRTLSIVKTLHGALGGALAILSGRPLDDLDNRLAPLVLPMAGTHGLERRDAQGGLHPAPLPEAPLAEARAKLAVFAEERGLLIEQKPAGASLHYRMQPDCSEAVRSFGAEIAAAYPELRMITGHMVVEVTAAGRDKGQALTAFMGETPFSGRVPLAAGDDTTDEDAFAAAQAAGGTAIKIGPGSTCAQHQVPDIDAFLAWLGDAAAGIGNPAQDATAISEDRAL